MSDLLLLVTPHTRSLIWLTQAELTPSSSYYKDIDYILNGLLTATLKSSLLANAQVLVGESFGNPFYLFICREISEKEARSFFELIKNDLGGENVSLVIDETNMFSVIQKFVPAEIKNKFRLLN